MISRIAEEELSLSAVDQNAARVYIQTLQLFPFPDDRRIEVAVKTLSEGLQVTLAKLPFLAGTLEPADPVTGRLSLRYPTEFPDVQEAGLLAFKKLTYPDEFRHTYAQLKQDGMPPSALTGRIFCPDALRDRPGIPLFAEGVMAMKHAVPVLAVQTYFIRGGLVLSIYVHHSIMDFSGINIFWKHFAESVHDRCSMQTLPGKHLPDQSTLRSQLDAQIPSNRQTPVPESFTRAEKNFKPTLSESSQCSANLFVIPAAKIRRFRDELQQSFKGTTRLTICNVLAALVWIHVTRARAQRLQGHGYKTTDCGIAVDMRRRLEPQLTEEYMGVMAFFSRARLPISDLLLETRVTAKLVLPTALHIHETISRVDNTWIERHFAWFKSQETIRDTEPALHFRFGPDIYVTSWLNFGADHRWNIPGTTSEKPEFIRRVKDHGSDGGIIILPRSREVVDGKEAPYEVLVRLATVDMDSVVSEVGGLASWAERILE